ncbi:MAG: thioredoxin fold domain-containing protein [Pseudomonadota bacterium]
MRRRKKIPLVILTLTLMLILMNLPSSRSGNLFNRLIDTLGNRTCRAGDGLEWLDYKDGMKIALVEKKPIMINFYATWCMACKKMERETLSNTVIRDYLKNNFVNIRVDIDKEEELSSKYRIRGIPATCFLEYTGAPIRHLIGYAPPDKFIQVLKYIGGKYYKSITFQDFLKEGIKDGTKGE